MGPVSSVVTWLLGCSSCVLSDHVVQSDLSPRVVQRVALVRASREMVTMLRRPAGRQSYPALERCSVPSPRFDIRDAPLSRVVALLP